MGVNPTLLPLNKEPAILSTVVGFSFVNISYFIYTRYNHCFSPGLFFFFDINMMKDLLCYYGKKLKS